MGLEAVYFVTQIIATVAVVASLAYVGVQLTQNTKAIRSAALQSATEVIASNVSNLASPPENASMFQRGLEQYHSLSDPDRAQFHVQMCGIYLSIDSMYWLFKGGSLPQEIWDREDNGLRVWLATPGGRAAFELSLVSEGLRRHAQRHLASS